MTKPRTYVSSFDRPNIKYLISERSDEMKQINEFIKTYHKKDTGIVYCLSRDKVEKVAKALKNSVILQSLITLALAS